MFCTHERPKTTNYTQAGTRQISFYAKTDASSRATKKAHYSNADGHILNSSTLNPSIIGALQIDSSIDVFFFWSKTLVWIWFRIFQLSAKRTGSQNIPRRSGGQKRHTCIEDWTPLGVKWSLPWKKKEKEQQQLFTTSSSPSGMVSFSTHRTGRCCCMRISIGNGECLWPLSQATGSNQSSCNRFLRPWWYSRYFTYHARKKHSVDCRDPFLRSGQHGRNNCQPEPVHVPLCAKRHSTEEKKKMGKQSAASQILKE